jgi:integrase
MDGVRRQTRLARSKAEAEGRLKEILGREERKRLGLELATPGDDCTVKEVFESWIANVMCHGPAFEKSRGGLRHILESMLAASTVRELTAGLVEEFLAEKSRSLSPQSVNHLRGYLLRAFRSAHRSGKISRNPLVDVKRLRVPKRKPDFLRFDEVVPVLQQLAPRWRALFAVAIFTGMRKGELLGLRKSDVDLASGFITVRRSYSGKTTKGGHADAIPIASDLRPFLVAAMAASTSDLVFPTPNGLMMSPGIQLQDILRSALGRAGIVQGYTHVCRKRACGHAEKAPDAALRRCPTCSRKLWPKPIVRPLRFHDLRHTTASLLMMAGANPAAVQRILRHSDPRITTEVYGHLEPNYLRREVNLLGSSLPGMGNATPDADLMQEGRKEPVAYTATTEPDRHEVANLELVGAAGLEPTTPGFGGRYSIQMSYAP